jgi:hypothetical protein
VPLTKLQKDVLHVISVNRSPESYVAGALPLNRDGPRFSSDIDIFHEREVAVTAAAQADFATLIGSEFQATWVRRDPAIFTATVARGNEQTRLDWVVDSAIIDSSPHFPTRLSATYCIRSIWRSTRSWPLGIDANHAMPSTW